MKKIFFIILLFFAFTKNTNAQFSEPITWEASVEKISDTEYDIVFKATLEKDWHLYSQFSHENGSIPLVISNELHENEKPTYKLIGKAEESETKKAFNKTFGVTETYFEKSATLKQKIQLLENVNQIEIDLEGQVCKESCIFTKETFVLNLNGNTNENLVTVDAKSKELTEKLKLKLTHKERLTPTSNGENPEKKGLLNIFILGFFGGLLALLTPCVFPMIPLTVSFFTKHSKNRKKGISNAILYGFFIILIYILLSTPFHFLDSLDPEILNTISTNVWLNIFFFLILVFFAFSFFGYYELTLPSSWGNKMDSASSNIGGIIGTFFMALTLAIVSFSCTGPILGSLLAGSLTSDGGAMQLTAGMGGFGFALALPFALFAMFPSWLNSLPKSGGWLNTTKVVLGFLELALAFKFLSNADLVEHWGILKREIFIGIWIVIFIGLALYLFGKIKFPHDSPLKKLSFSRISFGILVVSFIIYLIPGLMKQPTWNLSLLSGFPPPQFYSLYQQQNECPLGLNCFKDFDEGLSYAKENNKPILLDFTGWACVNCRKMEENVWNQPKIYNILNKDYVLISLYVDDRKKLPKDKQFNFIKSNGKLKKIRTIGDVWSTFETVNFQTASQPYYVLLKTNLENDSLEILNSSKQYTNIDDYYNWLKKGLEQFETSQKKEKPAKASFSIQ